MKSHKDGILDLLGGLSLIYWIQFGTRLFSEGIPLDLLIVSQSAATAKTLELVSWDLVKESSLPIVSLQAAASFESGYLEATYASLSSAFWGWPFMPRTLQCVLGDTAPNQGVLRKPWSCISGSNGVSILGMKERFCEFWEGYTPGLRLRQEDPWSMSSWATSTDLVLP